MSLTLLDKCAVLEKENGVTGHEASVARACRRLYFALCLILALHVIKLVWGVL